MVDHRDGPSASYEYEEHQVAHRNRPGRYRVWGLGLRAEDLGPSRA